MIRIVRSAQIAGALMLLGGGLVGCFSATYVRTGNFDAKTLEQIKPGTSFSEVVTLLGPPHHIVDGSRRLLDEEAVWSLLRTTKPRFIPTRELTAPEGTVILVYIHFTFSSGSIPVHFRSHDRKNELFVFVSKADGLVTDVAGGRQ